MGFLECSQRLSNATIIAMLSPLIAITVGITTSWILYCASIHENSISTVCRLWDAFSSTAPSPLYGRHFLTLASAHKCRHVKAVNVCALEMMIFPPIVVTRERKSIPRSGMPFWNQNCTRLCEKIVAPYAHQSGLAGKEKVKTCSNVRA